VLGGPGDLGCTLLIEIDDPDERAVKLSAWPQIRRHDECKQSEGAEGRPEHTPEWPKTERWGVEGEEQRQEIAPQSRSGRNGAHDAGRN